MSLPNNWTIYTDPPTPPSAVDRLAATVDREAARRIEEYERKVRERAEDAELIQKMTEARARQTFLIEVNKT